MELQEWKTIKWWDKFLAILCSWLTIIYLIYLIFKDIFTKKD